MARKNFYLVVGLAALLVFTAALAFTANGVSNTAQNTPSIAMADSDLQVPPALPLSGKWQAKPVSGASVDLPWSNVRVNTDSTNEAHNEPFVAINPNNPNHMVVGANSWQSGDGHFEVYSYATFDGGQTWTASQPYINRNASRLNAADPTVAFGPKGDVYFAFVALTPAQGAVAVSRSVDGGLNWTSQRWATSFTTGADKPALIANGSELALFYQNGSIMGTTSNDSGQSWSAPATIEAGGRNAAPVAVNGKVHVFYSTANSIRVAHRIGNRYTTETVASATALQARPTRYRASIYPAVAADSHGNMHVAWADGRNTGHGNDILYSRSTNGVWSTPVTLNTDAGSSDQLMPALAVGPDGAVNVSWLDNRNDSANYNYDVYMVRSMGCGNFGPNTRVTSVASNPDNDPRTDGVMIGDYFAMAAGNGIAYAFWTDTRNNNADIYMAPVSINDNN
jgi:hypothetical protein